MSEQKGNQPSKKIVFKAYRNWMMWNGSIMNYERMQGPAIVKMMGEVCEDLYPGDKEKQQELLERHNVFFNTEPYLGGIVPGIVLGMEMQKARGDDVPGELISTIKTALMGPFAGIGDSLLYGTLMPILLSIALGLCTNGEVAGPLFFVLAMLVIMVPATWFLFQYGVKTGATAAQKILAGGLKEKVTRAASIIGLIVVGAVTASYAHFNLGLVYQQGELSVSLADTLNNMLMPNLPLLLMAFLSYFMMVHKK